MKRLLFSLLFAARLAAAQGCDDDALRIVEERDGTTIRLYAQTSNCLDATVTLSAELVNMRASPALPLTLDTKGQTRVLVATLTPANEGRWHYTFRFDWLKGGRGGKPDGTVYELPFAASIPHRLIQGYRGKFSHQAGSPNEYALDWEMPEGSVVQAARGGTVVAVRQDSRAHGATPQFIYCANYVVLRHADGTYGEYLHLQPDGVRVALGAKVAAGQPIALSGNTGFSSQPHLHFAVFRALDGKLRQTLPVKFKLRDGSSAPLTEGETY